MNQLISSKVFFLLLSIIFCFVFLLWTTIIKVIFDIIFSRLIRIQIKKSSWIRIRIEKNSWIQIRKNWRRIHSHSPGIYNATNKNGQFVKCALSLSPTSQYPKRQRAAADLSSQSAMRRGRPSGPKVFRNHYKIPRVGTIKGTVPVLTTRNKISWTRILKKKKKRNPLFWYLFRKLVVQIKNNWIPIHIEGTFCLFRCRFYKNL